MIQTLLVFLGLSALGLAPWMIFSQFVGYSSPQAERRRLERVRRRGE